MHLLFVDESGRLDQGGVFALGGVAIRDRAWPALRDLWHDTLRDAGWPLEREVKWHGIRKGEVLGPSPYSIGLQCADLVVAATAAAASEAAATGAARVTKLFDA